MAYNLGIDLGIASIGFAGVDLGKQKILFCGAHIFEAAENSKRGASLAEHRRTKRGTRRVISRRAQRKQAIRRLLAEYGLKDIQIIDAPECAPPQKSVWDLRKEALARQLTDAEFARVLFHIAKRRGFQSNRKGAEPNDIDGKKALTGAVGLQEAMVKATSPTIGAYLATLDKKRNGDGTYERFVTRDLLREEVKKIFEAQKQYKNQKISKKFQEKYTEIAFFQRPLQSSENMVGYCTLEPDEKRAPKFSYTAELFILWTKLNNIKIRDTRGNEHFLTQDEKNSLAEKAHILKSVSYGQVRKALNLSSEERFNIGYRKINKNDDSWEKIRETTERRNFLNITGYHALKTALDNEGNTDWQEWLNHKRDELDEISRILSFYEDSQQIDNMLSDIGLDNGQRKKLSSIINFSKTVDLSLKAIRNILPHMQSGLTYDKACKEAKYPLDNRSNKGLGEVPPFEDIRNPVVNRALAQARKVINAIIRKYGMPETIIIELARDIAKPLQGYWIDKSGKKKSGKGDPANGDRYIEGRRDIEKRIEKNRNERKGAKEHVAEILGIVSGNVSGEDILKYRLWYAEQHKFCFYCGAQITTEQFTDPTATQIDHIIPYRRSWDDSYMNKTLCHTGCNQEKGDRTPYEWLGGIKQWEGLVSAVGKLPRKKTENFLMENFDDEKAGKWKSRALNDTRYMARLLKTHLEESLALGKGNRVQARNGMLTFHLRGRWGFPDKNRRNDRHHALDAIVLACSTQGMVKQLADWNKYEARAEARAKKIMKEPHPPKPWESFREDAKDAVNNIFVTRQVNRKLTGAIHEDTIKSLRHDAEGKPYAVQRKEIRAKGTYKGLTLNMLKDLVDVKLMGGVATGRNAPLYNVLKDRLDEFGGKADKAFAAPLHMPCKNGQGPVIRSVRLITNDRSGFPVRAGIASNGDMAYVKVYEKAGKFYLCPVYIKDVMAGREPNRVIKQGKREEEWPIIDEYYSHKFDLYKNDYVKLKNKKGVVTEGYYISTHRGVGTVLIRPHDRGTKDQSPGVQNMMLFEKYHVDLFGNRSKTS